MWCQYDDIHNWPSAVWQLANEIHTADTDTSDITFSASFCGHLRILFMSDVLFLDFKQCQWRKWKFATDEDFLPCGHQWSQQDQFIYYKTHNSGGRTRSLNLICWKFSRTTTGSVYKGAKQTHTALVKKSINNWHTVQVVFHTAAENRGRSFLYCRGKILCFYYYYSFSLFILMSSSHRCRVFITLTEPGMWLFTLLYIRANTGYKSWFTRWVLVIKGHCQS